MTTMAFHIHHYNHGSTIEGRKTILQIEYDNTTQYVPYQQLFQTIFCFTKSDLGLKQHFPLALLSYSPDKPVTDEDLFNSFHVITLQSLCW